MTLLRSALATAAAAALLTVSAAMGTAVAAPADEDDPPRPLVGCAELVDYGDGWALINNRCDHPIWATVDVDGPDPDCTPIDGYGSGYVYPEPGLVPYYAYEC